MPNSIEGGSRTFSAADLRLFAVLCLPLLVLNILRMVSVPATHDEALTFNLYVSKSLTSIFRFDDPSANNHLLNTLATKFFTGFISNDIFFLRLTNLLGQVVYFIFSFRISKWLFDKKLLIVCSFMILNLQPFVFEFFGMCRGYGLSLALMLGCIYYLFKYLETGKPRLLIASLVFCILAVYANLSMLNFFLGVGAVVIFNSITRDFSARRFLIEISLLLTTSSILFLLLRNVIRRLIEADQLYYGGDKGFFHDTLQTLIQDSFYIGNNERLVTIIAIVVAASVALIFIIAGWSMLAHKTRYRSVLMFSVLLIIPVISTQLQHALLGTKFLISRTALLYLPLYLLLLLSFIEVVRKGALYVMVPLTLFMLFAFFNNYSIRQSSTWAYDRYDLAVMNKIVSGPKEKDISIGAYWLFAPALQYYGATRFKGRTGTIEKLMEYHPATDTVHDYYYVPRSVLTDMPVGYKIVSTYNDEFVLLTRSR